MTNPLRTMSFIEDSKIGWEDISAGTKRKIMTYDEKVMQVKVAFEKKAVGNLHQHHHTQISYVSKGVFEVEIDGETKTLKLGDSFYVASNLVHGVTCLETGELIDIFCPYREDFI